MVPTFTKSVLFQSRVLSYFGEFLKATKSHIFKVLHNLVVSKTTACKGKGNSKMSSSLITVLIE